MKAAIVATQRGHKVTIFEKGEALGGQLNISDYSERKWAIKSYRDYLVGQVKKLGIPGKLNTALTPQMGK